MIIDSGVVLVSTSSCEVIAIIKSDNILLRKRNGIV